MDKIIEKITDEILAKAAAQNAPLQKMTFTQYEDELEAHFDAFHDGTLSRHKLEKYLLSKGYDKAMAKAEIEQQIGIRNFKNEARRKDRLGIPG